MDIQKEKKAFEARFNHLDLSYVDDLGYCEYETQMAWEAWQAAKAQSEKALLEQFEINAKLAEKIESMVTYDRLQQLIEIAVKEILEQKA